MSQLDTVKKLQEKLERHHDDLYSYVSRSHEDEVQIRRVFDAILADVAALGDPPGQDEKHDNDEKTQKVTRMDTPKVISDDNRTASEASVSGASLVCRYCSQPQSQHRLANYSDGAVIGASVLVCPRSTFEEVQWYDR